jgi:alanine-glyoxylate transaminase / serine-glyoxylate transaminase / serine-pyruvate transaminase
MLFEEGLDQVFARHRHLAQGVRAAIIEGWKLPLCAKAPEWYSDTVSAVVVPEGIDGARVIDIAFTRYNLALGAGLSKVAGRVFRIGHLGDLNELMLMGAIAGTEMAMLDVGIPVTAGSGVAAASNCWRAQRRVGKQNFSEEQRLSEMPSKAYMHGRRQAPVTWAQ